MKHTLFFLRKKSQNYIPLNNHRLSQALNQFAIAVKQVMKTQPKLHIVEHFLKTPPDELEEILCVCEQLEEYEICDILLTAIKHKQKIAA